MSLELILLASNMLLVIGSISSDDILGHVLALHVLAVSAAEASLGLALIVSFHRVSRTVSLFGLNLLRN
jgi:NADH-quinone oxidoreductase subunit K